MKIFTAPQIRALDAYTIEHEPIASIDLMERASQSFVYWFIEQFPNNQPIKIFAGIGNNGGDGLAVGRILAQEYQYDVEVYAVRFSPKSSVDFQSNEKKLKHLINIEDKSDVPPINDDDIVIDAIFGSGLSRAIGGFTATLVNHINQSKATVVAIDIPSGLFCNDLNPDSTIIQADYTVSFQFPKLSFMLPQNDQYVGHWVVADIHLMEEAIQQTPTPYHYVDDEFARQLILPRAKFSHKGTFGHVLIMAGSYGKMGAAILAGKAALRTGSGLVSVHLPKCGYSIMQMAIPEIMCSIDTDNNMITTLPNLEHYKAIAIGPGIDKAHRTLKPLNQLMQSSSVPLVLDADALNLLAENPSLLKQLAANSILTPHPKEFERLVGKTANHYERLKVLIEFSQRYQIIVVLKGAHSAIATPDGNVYFNSTGNSGMATAGSGDVLTGMIVSLLGQGYAPKQAAILGVYLHGLAGDVASEQLGEASVIASDIIDGISGAYLTFK